METGITVNGYRPPRDGYDYYSADSDDDGTWPGGERPPTQQRKAEAEEEEYDNGKFSKALLGMDRCDGMEGYPAITIIIINISTTKGYAGVERETVTHISDHRMTIRL